MEFLEMLCTLKPLARDLCNIDCTIVVVGTAKQLKWREILNMIIDS